MSTIRRDSISKYIGFSINPIISMIKSKIKSLESTKDKIDISYMIPHEGTVVQAEQILIERKPTNIRKVYVVDGSYKVGWVVDCDLNNCMICNTEFWMGCRRHHCRACGILLCSTCSPYRVNIPALEPESGGSRVCIDCFGLKSNMTPIYIIGGTDQSTSSSVFSSDHSSRPNSVRGRRSLYFTPESDTTLSTLDIFETRQMPRYRESYIAMRRIIAPDITKTSLNTILEDGVPENIANRIWLVKALWLICMHKDDIKKVHIADLRGKYDYHGLDLREMQAIWYNLPVWDEAIDISKAEWREGFKTKLDWMAYREAKGTLPPNYIRHFVYDGYENIFIYDPEQPIGSRYQRAASVLHPAVESPDPRTRNSSLAEDDNEVEIPKLNHLESMSDLFKSMKTHSPKVLENVEEFDDKNVRSFFRAFHERNHSITGDNLSSDLQQEQEDQEKEDQENESNTTNQDKNKGKLLNNLQESRLIEIETNPLILQPNENGKLSPLTTMLDSLRKMNREESILSPLSNSSRRRPMDIHSMTSSTISQQQSSPNNDDNYSNYSNISSNIISSTTTSPTNVISTYLHPDELIELIKSGQAAKARHYIKNGCPIPSTEVATELLFYCLDTLIILPEPLGTFAVLIEVCDADVDAINSNGSTPLMILVELNQHDLYAYFLSRGANAMKMNDRGECPLSLGFQLGYEWTLNEFQIHQEELLLTSSDIDCIYRYISYLIIAGYGLKVSSLLEEYNISYYTRGSY